MVSNYRFNADGAYMGLLGRAVYYFATYESIVVHTIEKLEAGYLVWFTEKGPTAGSIAIKFGSAVEGADVRLAVHAATFNRLRKERDKLLHSHPYTADNGVQQLGYRGRHASTEWPLLDIEKTAHEFDDAAADLNDLFYYLWPSG